MGSEDPPTPITTVHVTGFGKFCGVSENPTEIMVNNLTEYMKNKGLPKGLVIGSCSVLETAGQGALVPLYQRFQSSITAKDTESTNSHRIIWTSLPVEDITKALAKKGYEVIISNDAGKFVYNYIYYQSLRFAEHNGTKSFSVHVPLFLTINEETRMQFDASLLEVLASVF